MPLHRGIRLAPWLLSALGACAPAAEPQRESVAAARARITNGSAAEDQPATVGLAAAGRIVCSGVLLSPRVVLSAAHCLRGALPENVVVGSDLATGTRIGILRKWIHPRYTVGLPEHDLGILLLEHPAEAAALAASESAMSSADAGRSVRIAGYGRMSAEDRGEPHKLQGTAHIDAVMPLSFTLRPSPSLPCSGDSGAPVLEATVDGLRILGIISSGDDACAERAVAVRVDAYRTSFLAPKLALIERTLGTTGTPCVDFRNCGFGLCVTPEDAPQFSYCSSPCRSDAECPQGMRCDDIEASGRICRYTQPSPGAIGSPCTSDDDCEYGLCAPFSTDARTCSMLCFPQDGTSCPAGSACVATSRESGAFGCRLLEPRDADRAGCSLSGQATAPKSDGAAALCGAALVLACLLAIRRRTPAIEALVGLDFLDF